MAAAPLEEEMMTSVGDEDVTTVASSARHSSSERVAISLERERGTELDR